MEVNVTYPPRCQSGMSGASIAVGGYSIAVEQLLRITMVQLEGPALMNLQLGITPMLYLLAQDLLSTLRKSFTLLEQ